MVIYIVTPCPSAPVKCAPVASPVNKFAEIVSPDPNYASSANKWMSFAPQWYLEKFVAPTEREYFKYGPRSSD